MRQRRFLLPALLVLLLIFATGKAGFMLYNSHTEALSVGESLLVWVRGLPLDLRTSAILLLLPALCSLQRKVSLRKLLAPYYLLVGLAIAVTTVGDTVMYEFWHFKLSSVVLSYAASPEGATNSVPPSFIATRFGAVVLLALVTAMALTLVTPKRARREWFVAGALLVLALLPIGVGSCYRQGQSLFRSHAATNPTFAFALSFKQEYSALRYMSNEECLSLSQALYPTGAGELLDTLLSTTRPNILIVQWESLSGKFVKETGGLPDVTPNLSHLISEGVFFSHYYSNSFRTDRGTVSLQSGTLSHPSVSLMRESKLHSHLPSLPRTLTHEAGYKTIYLYGGPMTNMGKELYLRDIGYDTLLDGTAFEGEEPAGTWGAHDKTTARLLPQLLAKQDTARPWLLTYQTISSHEPWQVPYQRLSDPVLNAFAYTDHCLAQLIDSLRALPLWNNLLVIVIPDHGYLYQQTYEDPEFFHSPMLWLGGALKGEARTVDVLMNQSDIAATLLGQMQLPHADFPFSRDVLSSAYTYPFAYCNFPAGLMLRDSTGVSLFDLTASRPILESPSPSPERIRRARAIMQRTYLDIHDR